MQPLSKIAERFIGTFLINSIRIVFVFVSNLLLARYLGPGQFGEFNFLSASFLAIFSFLDLGGQAAFFTLISQHKHASRFYTYYAVWMALRLLIPLLLLALAPQSILDLFWLGARRDLLFLAAISSFCMTQLWTTVTQMGESLRDSIGLQLRNLTLAVIFLILIMLMHSHHALTIGQLFSVNIFIYTALSFAYIIKLRRLGLIDDHAGFDSTATLNVFTKYFRSLALFNLLTFANGFLDPWLLQLYAGSADQAFIAIAQRFSFLILLAGTSFSQIFWKEISEAFVKNNRARFEEIFNVGFYGFYFLTAFLSAFAIPLTAEIIEVCLGHTYASAYWPMLIMFIYPLHNMMNIILDLTLIATERPKLKSIAGISYIILSLLLTPIVLAPSGSWYFGLGLGATGIAIKLVFAQVVQANLSALLIRKALAIRIKWLWQFNSFFLLLLASYISKLIFEACASYFWPVLRLKALYQIGFGALFYTVIVSILCYFWPRLLGMNSALIKLLTPKSQTVV